MGNQKERKPKARSGRPAVDPDRRTLAGQIIRQYRMKAGLDQAELAERLGYTKNAVGGWETGRTRPDIGVLPRLCEVLGIPVTELLGLPGETALSREERSLLERYRRLDPYDRDTVSRLTDRLLYRQDSREQARLRETYAGLRLYEEAAAAGVSVPMADSAGFRTVYALRSRIPGGADAVIRVNGESMEPTYPDGSYVYVNTRQAAAPGQTGIFIVNNEAFIKELRPEGLVSHNRRFRTIAVSGDAEVRCVGRVTGPVAAGDLADEHLCGQIEAALAGEA